MKERYIRQVSYALRMPRRKKQEVIRDLNEIFASAQEHGETAQQVIERLGSPRDFAAGVMENADVRETNRALQKGSVVTLAALLAALAAFTLAVVTGTGVNAPNVIGQADAMTGIQVEGMVGLHPSMLFLLIGLLFLVLAVSQMIRTVRAYRRTI